MFNKIKENEKVEKLKELWNNPKTHDFIVLIFWLVFITVVIMFTRINFSSPTPVTETKTKTLETLENYDFTYKTNNEEIQGQAYNDKIIFYKNNKRYYYSQDVFLIDEKALLQPNYDLGILKINTKMLNNLISGITPNENDNFKTYIIPLDRFINLYEIDTTLDLTIAQTKNIIISVYLKDNQINKIIMDLSSYYTMKNNFETNYSLTIYYYNINNVKDFTKEYQKIVEVQ